MKSTPLEELERLKRAHQTMEGELHTLMRRRHLTPLEIQRSQILKKRKLRTKDKMRILTSQARVEY